MTSTTVLCRTAFLAAALMLLLTMALGAKAGCADCPAPGVDWSGCNLSGVDLSFADLDGADLSNANLHGATFKRPYLIATNPSDATRSDTFFGDADPYGAYLKRAELSGDESHRKFTAATDRLLAQQQSRKLPSTVSTTRAGNGEIQECEVASEVCLDPRFNRQSFEPGTPS